MLTVTLAFIISLAHLTLAGTETNCTKQVNDCNTFALGNSLDCHDECSNSSLAYIILFALMGAVGVALIALLGLTVSTGTFNALIFYVNIVQANYDILFKNEKPSKGPLIIFLSWLNLEWGIETCLCKKMTAVTKVGLCYVFPVYFCLLAGVFVRVANMKKLRKYCKKLSTSVLATAILLSYSPILRTFIESTLKGNGDCWHYQRGYRYFKKEHGALFVSGFIIIFFYLIPFTLLLVFGPLLQPLAHHKPLNWIHKPCISTLFINFHSPLHKNKLWPGILLLARVLLFTTALVAKSGKISDDTNLNIIIITVMCLAFTAWITEMPYKGVLLNSVTIAFLLNLGVLAVWFRCNSTHQHTMKYIMVGLAGVKFLLLVGYQTLHRLRQLVQYARDCHQRQNVDSFDETFDTDIPMDSLQGSFGGEYIEIGEDLTAQLPDQNGGDQNGGDESDPPN